MRRLQAIWERAVRSKKMFSPSRVIVLGLLGFIFLGAFLLHLPVSSRSGDSVPFLTALFTSASAMCVTGLAVVDTATTWSFFGKAVILFFVQIGGLGFMTVITIFFFIMGKQISISQRLLIMASLNLNDMQGVVKLVRNIVTRVLVIEAVGAVILWIRFSFEYDPWKALGLGVFYSVAAFCNAGFDLTGEISPYAGLTPYANDIVIPLTTAALVFIGGLGFFVWEDIRVKRQFKKLHLHSKMVLIISVGLTLLGWLFFYLAERGNPNTIGGMSGGNAAIASLFQSIMPRSGGMSIIHQSQFTDASKLMTMLFMFIGGSAGSTAGGIKNVTAGILVLSAISSMRGRKMVSAFHRTIPSSQVLSALSILLMAVAACFVSSIAISAMQDLPYLDILFDVVSAMGTVGLSCGITHLLSPASQVILILLMFFGRVGIMTMGMAVLLNRYETENIKYPDSWIMMG